MSLIIVSVMCYLMYICIVKIKKHIMKKIDIRNCLYKVTYLDYLHCSAFVRVVDGAILYTNASEDFVSLFAEGFCTAEDVEFYIE